MERIIIGGTHPVFIKNSTEELEMLRRNDEEEIFYYICCRGIKSYDAQVQLQDMPKWITLQELVHPELWDSKVLSKYKELGLISVEDIPPEQEKENFKRWLCHNLMISSLSYSSEKEYGAVSQLLLAAGVKLSKTLTEKEEIELLQSKDWETVQKYDRQWHGAAEILFFQTAPVELIFAYLRVFRPQSEEAECAILRRNDSCLTWSFISFYSLGDKAKKMVKYSGNIYAWKQVVMRSYGFDNRLEQKFGSIRNLQMVLEKTFNKKYL